MASKNNGKFPSNHVAAVLSGQADVMADGSKDMPVWGPVFFRISQGHPTEVQQRISNLTGISNLCRESETRDVAEHP